jgi:hypothetical protein
MALIELNNIKTQKTAFHVGILSIFTDSDTVKMEEKTYNKIPFNAYRSRHSISSKFLINCLGLSDNAVFQDFGYASQQLDGKYNRLDKINYIQKKLSEAKNKVVTLIIY